MSLHHVLQQLKYSPDLEGLSKYLEVLNYLFGEAKISGKTIELASSINVKLKEAVKIVEKANDPSQLVALTLDKEQSQLCLEILNEASFEAQYATLVLSIKKKLSQIITEQHNQ